MGTIKNIIVIVEKGYKQHNNSEYCPFLLYSEDYRNGYVITAASLNGKENKPFIRLICFV